MIAEGADHVPSANRAITNPVPRRPVKQNPALATVRKAKPLAPISNSLGIRSLPSTMLSLVKFHSVCVAFLISDCKLLENGRFRYRSGDNRSTMVSAWAFANNFRKSS